MNKIIIPTGYMGSGSSAITDLVAEMEGYEAEQGRYEYVFLHCPNGVFDLEDKLLIGNNAIRSDEALHSFYFTMKELFEKKYWWVGHYNETISKDFMKITEEYIEDLIQYKPEFYWYYQENTNIRMFFQLILRRLIQCISMGKIKGKKPLLYPEMWITYVQEEEFYKKTQKYIYRLLVELGINDKNIILDQLLLPFNLYRLQNYFEDNVEVFVVERDPRDMFIINKYIYPSQNEQVPYPTDVHQFCECYKRLRSMEKPVKDEKHIHRIHFEDLIYKYEESVERIQNALGQGSGRQIPKHIKKRVLFNPDQSIENTQLFNGTKQFREEAMIIEKKLAEYLYDFPYKRETDLRKTF